MTDPKTCRIKPEDTEQQIGWYIFLILQYDYKTSSGSSDSVRKNHKSCKITVKASVQKKLRVSLVHCFDDYIEFRLSYSAWMKMIDCGILAPVIKALTVHKSFMPSKLAPAK